MTVTNQTPRIDVIATGSDDSWDFDFPIFAAEDLAIYENGVLKSIPTHYTVTLVNGPSGHYEGGTITRVAGDAAEGVAIAILRREDLTQQTALTTSNSYRSGTHQRVIDRLVMQMQQVQEELRHAIRFPLSEDLDGGIGSAIERASKYLGFDPDGNVTLANAPSGSGGGGTGGGIGIDITAEPYNAQGTGITDDTAAIQAALDAAPIGGVVYAPVGNFLTTGRLSVPYGVTFLGESYVGSKITGPGIDLDGDHATVRNLQFVSTDAVRCMVKSNNVDYPMVRECWFNRAHVILSNDTTSDLTGGTVDRCLFSGSYLPWVASVNLIEVRGMNNVHITDNKLLEVTDCYRFIKLQASIAYLSGEVLGQYCNGLVMTGNILTGTMSSGKQVVDMFDGVGRAVISGNVMLIESSGSGFSTFLEQKTGDGSGLQSPWASQLIITDNVLVGAPEYAPIMVTGAYSLAWEGVEQSVTISKNEIKVDASTGSLVGIEVRGIHHASIVDNTIDVTNYGTIYRAVSAGNCKSLHVADNTFVAGLILVWGGSTTTTGDPYTGATVEVNITGNVLENFRSDHGGVELSGLVGTPSLVCTGNHLNSTMAGGTLALVYLNNCALTSVTCIGNIGDCGQANRNRLLHAGTTTVTVQHEYFNSWQTKTVLEYDTALHRVTIGDASTSVTEFYEMGSGNQFERYVRVAGVTRMTEIISASSLLQYSYDAAGALVDNYLNVNLNAGGQYTINRPVDILGRVRPLTDAVFDLGTSSLRFRSLYLQGGQTCGVSTVKTSNFSPTDDEFLVLVDCTAGNITCTLPAGSVGRNGRRWKFRRIDGSGNTFTVQRSGSDTVLSSSSSVTSFTIGGGSSSEVAWDNANARWVRD